MISKKRQRSLLSLLAFLFLLFAYATLSFLNTPLIPANTQFDYYFESGQTLSQLANRLHEKNWLPHPKFLRVLSMLRGQAGRLQAGEYRFVGPLRPTQLLDQMVAGNVLNREFTIIEGSTFQSVFENLQNTLYLSGKLNNKQLSSLLTRWGASTIAPEGLFFPDTYAYTRGESETVLLKRSFDKMHALLNQIWQQREVGLPYKKPYQVLIVASIIEKETALPKEKPIIADVILKRWRKRMRLQMDPTVIYGLNSKYQGALTRALMRVDTPFNTYLHRGLPPTPIALPSLSSLMAAAHPAKTPYWYFVADGKGGHVFSKTLAEQRAAIRKLRLAKEGIS
jgi:peptidoglycan lytic transglycosylase G